MLRVRVRLSVKLSVTLTLTLAQHSRTDLKASEGEARETNEYYCIRCRLRLVIFHW